MAKLKSRHPVSKALIDLRNALGETQQQFAVRIGASVTTIARYETFRPPHGKTLVQIADIAQQRGLDELASVFHQAFDGEVGRTPRASATWMLQKMGMFTSIFNPEDRIWAVALSRVLSDKKLGPIANRIKSELNGVREQIETQQAAVANGARRLKQIVQLLQIGTDLDESFEMLMITSRDRLAKAFSDDEPADDDSVIQVLREVILQLKEGKPPAEIAETETFPNELQRRYDALKAVGLIQDTKRTRKSK